MDVLLMLAALPLMMFGGFALDAFSHRDDDREVSDSPDAPLPDSGHPPII